MQMIPSTPHATESRAELRIFDYLQGAFANDAALGLTVFHSLNLTRHQTKRFGEIDFLIVGKPGIFVLEIKGGGISCQEGRWYTTTRSGDRKPLKESPFVQAETALHGLMDRLSDSQPRSVWSSSVIGYGVIFPDCDWTQSGAEWDRAILVDSRGSRNLEHWLRELFRHWRERDHGRTGQIDDDALTELKHFFRPQFDMAVPLHVQLEELQERVVAMTDDQMRMLDVVDANARVVCSGGAGTGKTFLALELARRWAASGQKVLIACRSSWLKRWLETKFALPGVVVAVAESARVAARRNGIDRFDALIVDEGQDLLDMASLGRLDAVLKDGLNQGRWCFFHDKNNQAGFFGPPDPDALKLIETLAMKVPLSTNCRNTRQILDKVQSTLGADMGVRGSGDGPRVTEHETKTRADATEILAAEIDRLIEHNGLSPSGITILSERPFAESAAAGLPLRIVSEIVVLDEYALRHFPPRGISFARIADFKGLENEAILLIDLPRPPRSGATSPNHYVGMSRARSLLDIIWNSYTSCVQV